MATKSKAPTIWVVEQGAYSGYRVVGVFTSKKNAKMVADAINGGTGYDQATIAEWPLNPAVDELNQGLTQFNVHMLRDGTTAHVEPWDVSSYKIAGDVSIWYRSKALGNFKEADILTGIVWAKDVEHAVKIMNEHRTQLIATNKWKAPK